MKALNDLLIDNQSRLWISTIVEDFEVYEWWVLKETGELLGQFTLPRNEAIEKIIDGHVYTRETDQETELQRIVRYRVQIDP